MLKRKLSTDAPRPESKVLYSSSSSLDEEEINRLSLCGDLEPTHDETENHHTALPVKPEKETLPADSGILTSMKIGGGGDGEVRRVEDSRSFPSQVFAEKIYRTPELCQQEYEILKNMNHEGIIQVLGIEDNHMKMEYFPNGDLHAQLEAKNDLPKRRIVKDITNALFYLHEEKKVVHNDIKAANILLDESYHAKLCDFAHASVLDEQPPIKIKNNRLRGTYMFIAPEVFKQGYSQKSDVWGLGLLTFHLVTGQVPRFHPNIAMEAYLVATLYWEGIHPPESEVAISSIKDDRCRDFISKCLLLDPDRRPTAGELLTHPYLTNECPEPMSD